MKAAQRMPLWVHRHIALAHLKLKTITSQIPLAKRTPKFSTRIRMNLRNNPVRAGQRRRLYLHCKRHGHNLKTPMPPRSMRENANEALRLGIQCQSTNLN